MYIPDINAAIRSICEPHVQKGAALLDEKLPGWAQKISTDKLNLSRGDVCICGQLFGSYHSRTLATKDPHLYGFDLAYTELTFGGACGTVCQCGCGAILVGDAIIDQAWAMLDALWVEEVYWRMG